MAIKNNQVFYKTKEFKRLAKKWSEELQASGFKDIEEMVVPLDSRTGEAVESLKKHSSHFSLKYDKEYMQHTLDYYLAASCFLQTYKFANAREKLIWRLHSEGVGYRAMNAVIRARGYKSATHNAVFRIVSKLRAIMIDLLHKEE